MQQPDSDQDSDGSDDTVLSLTSENYWDRLETLNLGTDELSQEARRHVIRPNARRLRAASKRYRLDFLLIALLEFAPNDSGKRYITICLHIALRKGPDVVVNAAKAWLDYLVLPSMFVLTSLNT